MPIKCCENCVPPKREPGCHDRCEQYLEEKAEHERLKALHDNRRNVRNGIYLQRTDKVVKAMRKHGRKW